MKLNQFNIFKQEENKTVYTMTERTIKMDSKEMNGYFGQIRGVIIENACEFGSKKVGVKVGKHEKFSETFCDNPFEVMNDLLTEVIVENSISFR